MNEHLYSIGLEHKKTEERIDLQVWAKNTDEATHKLTGILIGYDCTYRWTGTGPVYENNKIVTRKAKDTRYRERKSIMHYTYADASFALLEEMGKEALEAINQTQSESYHGTLLTDLTVVNGTPEELFLGTLSVGDIRTVESILKAGNLGYAKLYRSSDCAPEVYIFSMSPENIASFLGSHQFDCFKMILTDLFDRLILDTIYGFIDHCPDRNLLQQLLPHLIPIQQSEEAPKSFPMAAYDTFEAYGLLVDLLQSGKTIEELRQESASEEKTSESNEA